MSVYKKCTKCGRSFPANKKYYNENKTSKDGFQSYCLSCQRKQEVADALKGMRKGVRPKKHKGFKAPKVPNFSQIMKSKRND